MVSGAFREHVIREVQVNEQINEVALKVKSKSEMTQRHEVLRKSISQLSESHKGNFWIPLDPRMEVSDFEVEKCKVLNSKKLPLFLQMSCQQLDKSVQVIFKNGDDLRQDLLTLQVIRVIDRIWLDAGLDFRMKPYKVIATDDQVGLIEVVSQAKNISAIHEESG